MPSRRYNKHASRSRLANVEVAEVTREEAAIREAVVILAVVIRELRSCIQRNRSEMQTGGGRNDHWRFARVFAAGDQDAPDCAHRWPEYVQPASSEQEDALSESKSPMSPEQTTKPNLVLSVRCDRDGEHPFILDPPQGRDSFRIVVRCTESKCETSSKPSSGFSQFVAKAWALLSNFAACIQGGK